MLRRSLWMGVTILGVACGDGMDRAEEEPSSLGSTRQGLALFEYSAVNTNSAQDVNNSAHGWLDLVAGETVMIGTCGLAESAYSGDTYLRLYDPQAAQVGFNDDACNGVGSRIDYTATATGTYSLRAGCLGSASCSGTLSIARRKATYTVTGLLNTQNASRNTFNKQYSFNGGDVIRVSTCASNAHGAAATGDTYLRLFQQINGVYTEVASNDTGSGWCGTAAELVYSVPAAGFYQIRMGCSANTGCGGTVAVYVE